MPGEPPTPEKRRLVLHHQIPPVCPERTDDHQYAFPRPRLRIEGALVRKRRGSLYKLFHLAHVGCGALAPVKEHDGFVAARGKRAQNVRVAGNKFGGADYK